jgi:uncharacterized protein YjhX (UPF0386 family)
MIRKSGKKWCLYTKKKDKSGKRRKLGCYSSKKGAENREKQVKMFKHLKEEKIMKLSKQKLKEIIKEELDEMRGGGTGDSRLPVAAFSPEERTEIPVPDQAALAAKGEEQKQVEITKGKLRSVFLEIAKEIQQQTTISVAEMQLLVHVLRELIENAIAGNTNSGAVKQILQVALDKIDQSTGVE